MICEEFEQKRFLGSLQEKMNRILYKLSRKYKNPGIFKIDKNRIDLDVAMSCFMGKWDDKVSGIWYDWDSDFRDYYKNHNMLILVNQTYGHKINTIKIEVKNSFEFGLDKFMPVVYIEYQLENNSEEITKKLLLHICIGPNWYDKKMKTYKKGYK